jgi:hypothetical protein
VTTDDSGDGDGGYVHREGEAADADAPAGFGRRGWILVGVVVLGTLVVPGVIYLYPAAPADAGLPFLAAMLVLPMLPAVLFGAAAVWSMTAATGER